MCSNKELRILHYAPPSGRWCCHSKAAKEMTGKKSTHKSLARRQDGVVNQVYVDVPEPLCKGFTTILLSQLYMWSIIAMCIYIYISYKIYTYIILCCGYMYTFISIHWHIIDIIYINRASALSLSSGCAWPSWESSPWDVSTACL